MPFGSDEPLPSSVTGTPSFTLWGDPASATGGSFTVLFTVMSTVSGGLFTVPSFTTKLNLRRVALSTVGEAKVGDATVVLLKLTAGPAVCVQA